jgi:hypothetical protein
MADETAKKYILITVVRGLIPDNVIANIGPSLAQTKRLCPFVLTLNPVAANFGSKAVEVYALDGLAEIELDEVRRLCENLPGNTASTKHATSFRLTEEALQLLVCLAGQSGISQSAALEKIIRDASKQQVD